tara:strand:- start:267 stop:860 length:594 start_codon:yes stop_codon:yes gene_type:complete
MNENKDIIVINKYSSRRLYNTNSSEYVTLDDLCKLINDGKNFKIIDKDSSKDITNQYLLQIISDLENKEGSIFPQDVLKDIILSYNNTAQKFMPDLLSKTFEVFRQQQENFLKAFNAEDQQNKTKNESSDFFEEWQKNQTDIMEKMMQPWIKNPMFNANKDVQSSDSEATKNNKNDEIDVLKQQIDELRDIITKKNT